MLKRVIPFVLGFGGGALIGGGLETRYWSGDWGTNGGAGMCVGLGVFILIGTLIVIAAIEDGAFK